MTGNYKAITFIKMLNIANNLVDKCYLGVKVKSGKLLVDAPMEAHHVVVEEVDTGYPLD